MWGKIEKDPRSPDDQNYQLRLRYGVANKSIQLEMTGDVNFIVVAV